MVNREAHFGEGACKGESQYEGQEMSGIKIRDVKDTKNKLKKKF